MDDSISRREAIEAVEHITSSMSVCVNTDECHGMKRMQRQAVRELVNLPSTQPEVIRCKDCLIHGVCRFEQGLGLDGYCSQAERRTDG